MDTRFILMSQILNNRVEVHKPASHQVRLQHGANQVHQPLILDFEVPAEEHLHEKLDQSIQIISSKQIQAIKEWEKNHPNYLQNESELKEWHDMLKTAMGPINNLDKKNKNNSIKKELSSTVVVDQLETIENLEALTQ